MSAERIHYTILVLAALMCGAERLGFSQASYAFAICLGLFCLSAVYDDFKAPLAQPPSAKEGQ